MERRGEREVKWRVRKGRCLEEEEVEDGREGEWSGG